MTSGVYFRTDENRKNIGLASLGRIVSDATKIRQRESHLGRKYKPMSEIGKFNISNALTGRKLSDELKIRLSKIHIENGTGKWMKGKKLSKETCDKMSINRSGSGNSRWKGGQGSYLKKLALKRDNYTCVKCGFSDKRIMRVDHILPRANYPELKNCLENLQTLCPNCDTLKTIQDIKKYSIGNKGKWKRI